MGKTEDGRENRENGIFQTAFCKRKNKIMKENTIAAIATPEGNAGLGVIRISGENAFQIADRIYKSKRGRLLADIPPYTASFGYVYKNNEKMDECVALVFRAPHSYTGENTVELSCHGGRYLLGQVLEAAIEAGALPAGPGEFTKRAFLNGKMDLTRAESVMDLIAAQGRAAMEAAFRQHEGALFKKIKTVREQLTEISADIAAWVDFPEEDVPELDPALLEKRLKEAEGVLQNLIERYEAGRVIREGIETVIAGRPNSGKSTLMNQLAGYEKSIVTDLPGTTRDIIEEEIRFAGLVLKISDTAGIREAKEPVEKLGVERALKRIQTAELVIAVFDGSEKLSPDDRRLMELCKGKNAIAVINKADLAQKIEKEEVRKFSRRTVEISAKTGKGLDELEKAVGECAGTRDLRPGSAMLANRRQLSCAVNAKDSLKRAIADIQSGITLDAVNVDIDGAEDALYELTGEKASESVIEKVFEKFCVGK